MMAIDDRNSYYSTDDKLSAFCGLYSNFKNIKLATALAAIAKFKVGAEVDKP